MKTKLHLLTKTLLVAAGLCVGVKAWGIELLNQPFTQLYDGEDEITAVTNYGFTVVSGTYHTVTDGKLQFSGGSTSANSTSGEVYTDFTAASSDMVILNFTWKLDNTTGARATSANTGNSSYASFYLADQSGNKVITVYYFGQLKELYVNGTSSENKIATSVDRSQTFTVKVMVDMGEKIVRSLKLTGTGTYSANNISFEGAATSIGRFGYKTNAVKSVITNSADNIVISQVSSNYTLNAINGSGDNLKTITTGYNDFDETASIKVNFPKAIDVDGTWYTTTETTFAKTFTGEGTQTVTYSVADPVFNYFYEFEIKNTHESIIIKLFILCNLRTECKTVFCRIKEALSRLYAYTGFPRSLNSPFTMVRSRC